jgi:hypothetical protein
VCFQRVVSHEMFQGLWVIIAINHQMACQKESSHKSRWNGFLWMSWHIMTHYERKRVIKGYYGIFDIFQSGFVLGLQKVHTHAAQVPWCYPNCHIILNGPITFQIILCSALCMSLPSIFHCTRPSAIDQTPCSSPNSNTLLATQTLHPRYAISLHSKYACYASPVPLFFTAQRLKGYILCLTSVLHLLPMI